MTSPRLIHTATGRSFPLKSGKTTIGREDTCDLVLDDVSVSGRHATITRSAEGRYAVCDLGSTNGTFLNGSPTTVADLRDGALVGFGQLEFCFRCDDAGSQIQTSSTVQQLAAPIPRSVIIALFAFLGIISVGIFALVFRTNPSGSSPNLPPPRETPIPATSPIEPQPPQLSDEVIRQKIASFIHTECKEWPVTLTGGDLRKTSPSPKVPSELERKLDAILKEMIKDGTLRGEPYNDPAYPRNIAGKKYVPTLPNSPVVSCYWKYWLDNPYSREPGIGTVEGSVKETGTPGVVEVTIKREDGRLFTEEQNIAGWIQVTILGLSAELNRVESKLIDSSRGVADIVFTVVYRPNERAESWMQKLEPSAVVREAFKSFVLNPYHMRLQRFDDGWHVINVQMLKEP